MTNKTVAASPSVMTPEGLTEKVKPITNAISQLEAQAERAIINSDESLATGGDLYKIINSQIKKNDEARTSLVKPLNDHVKWINSQFKPNADSLDSILKNLKAKMNTYVSERQKKLDQEAAEQKRLAEEEALNRAAEHEAAGNSELANDIVESAASMPTAAPKAAIARGGYGGATSSRTDWKGECVSVKELCAAIGRGDIPEDFITVNQAKLNALALSKKEEKTNFGIRLYKNVSASVR
jgi:hypothetical protein